MLECMYVWKTSCARFLSPNDEKKPSLRYSRKDGFEGSFSFYQITHLAIDWLKTLRKDGSERSFSFSQIAHVFHHRGKSLANLLESRHSVDGVGFGGNLGRGNGLSLGEGRSLTLITLPDQNWPNSQTLWNGQMILLLIYFFYDNWYHRFFGWLRWRLVRRWLLGNRLKYEAMLLHKRHI